jgi:probable rRNA maturation factor
MRQLELHIAAPRVSAGHVAYLRKHLLGAHRILRSPLRELSLALVGDRTMSRLHQEFMGIDGPTDVLTFPLDFTRSGKAVSGEVIVCVAEARRGAKRHKTLIQKELLLYALHGMLHLNGMDDRTDSDFNRVHRMEDQILRRLGVGAVFKPCGKGVRPCRG